MRALQSASGRCGCCRFCCRRLSALHAPTLKARSPLPPDPSPSPLTLTRSDPEQRAVARWRLAMSFWEVHAARRCWRRWRLYAQLMKLGEEEDEASRLTARAFQWWRGMALHYRKDRQLGEGHWQEAALSRAFASWAQRLEQREGDGGGAGNGGQRAVGVALQQWVGGSLQSCFNGWRW